MYYPVEARVGADNMPAANHTLHDANHRDHHKSVVQFANDVNAVPAIVNNAHNVKSHGSVLGPGGGGGGKTKKNSVASSVVVPPILKGEEKSTNANEEDQEEFSFHPKE